MKRPAVDAEPGTGVERHIEVQAPAEEHPRWEDILAGVDYDHEEATLVATQYRAFDRTWQCGGTYWDRQLDDIVELVAVIRKSTWCDTRDAEDATLKFVFEPEHARRVLADGPQFTYDPVIASGSEDRFDPSERFLGRHNVPFELPP